MFTSRLPGRLLKKVLSAASASSEALPEVDPSPPDLTTEVTRTSPTSRRNTFESQIHRITARLSSARLGVIVPDASLQICVFLNVSVSTEYVCRSDLQPVGGGGACAPSGSRCSGEGGGGTLVAYQGVRFPHSRPLCLRTTTSITFS